MIARVHDMPFGAQILDEGARFRLWAPSVERVDLLLDDAAPQAMSAAGDGWFELVARDARAGATYAFRLPDGLVAPDPAARAQAANGRSLLVDPAAFQWSDAGWRGRPWEEAVLYEAHLGTVTTAGAYTAFADRFEALADLGVTAIELMPLANAPGARNWGYDGVLHFAPNDAYGTPDELKAMIDRAHACGLMVFIDVVYNHFGPSGNYLHAYAKRFFTERHQTPWGAGLNFDDEGRETVRAFFVQNALYWLREFHADGLRFDAVHAIRDDSDRHILAEIAETVRENITDREIHLVLENDANEARWLERVDGKPRTYTAQWNDDAHHCWHALLTGERDGYYEDFASQTPARLARALAEGFVYQGESSALRDGETRGEPSAHLPPTAFVNFLQNHDQIGNRAHGERIDALAAPHKLEAARAALLLAPHIPMLFMGEEWASRKPFLYFVDFSDDPALADAVREGRRREFSGFGAFGASDPPDPTAEDTFHASQLDATEAATPEAARAHAWIKSLLELRREHVTPLLRTYFMGAASAGDAERGLVDVRWRFSGGTVRLALNVGEAPVDVERAAEERVVLATMGINPNHRMTSLAPWSVLVTTQTSGALHD